MKKEKSSGLVEILEVGLRNQSFQMNHQSRPGRGGLRRNVAQQEQSRKIRAGSGGRHMNPGPSPGQLFQSLGRSPMMVVSQPPVSPPRVLGQNGQVLRPPFFRFIRKIKRNAPARRVAESPEGEDDALSFRKKRAMLKMSDLSAAFPGGGAQDGEVGRRAAGLIGV